MNADRRLILLGSATVSLAVSYTFSPLQSFLVRASGIAIYEIALLGPAITSTLAVGLGIWWLTRWLDLVSIRDVAFVAGAFALILSFPFLFESVSGLIGGSWSTSDSMIRMTLFANFTFFVASLFFGFIGGLLAKTIIAGRVDTNNPAAQ